MKTSIKLDTPKLQTRLNIPGLHFFPKIDPLNTTQTDRLKANQGVPFFWDMEKTTETDGFTFYSEIVAAEKAKYAEKATDTSNGVVKFDWDTLGDCNKGNFGWDSDSPCVFLRINRVIGWEPVGLFKPDSGSIFEADGPKKPMERDAVYMRCKSKFIGEELTEEQQKEKALTFDYYGGANNDGYVSKEFFPYGGKVAQPNYQSPIVAVKVKGLKEGEKHRITCQAHAKNIVIDSRDNLGHIAFEMQHKGDIEKTE